MPPDTFRLLLPLAPRVPTPPLRRLSPSLNTFLPALDSGALGPPTDRRLSAYPPRLQKRALSLGLWDTELRAPGPLQRLR